MLVDVALDVAKMLLHQLLRPVAFAFGDRGGDLLVEAGIDGLALVAMGVLAQPAPAAVALAGMERVEDREKQGIARRLGDGAVEAGIGFLVAHGITGCAGLAGKRLQQLDLRLGSAEGRKPRHHRLDGETHLDHLERVGVIEDVFEGRVRRCGNCGPRQQGREARIALAQRRAALPQAVIAVGIHARIHARIHESAAALMARDAPLLLQHIESPAQRPAPDAELAGERALRRHARALVIVAVLDELPQPAQGLIASLHLEDTCALWSGLCRARPDGPGPAEIARWAKSPTRNQYATKK